MLMLPLVFVSNSKILEDPCILNHYNPNQIASCYILRSYFSFSFTFSCLSGSEYTIMFTPAYQEQAVLFCPLLTDRPGHPFKDI